MGSIIFRQSLEMNMDLKKIASILDQLDFNCDKGLYLSGIFQLKDRYTLSHSPDEFALYEVRPGELDNHQVLDLFLRYFPESYEITCVFEKKAGKFEISSLPVSILPIEKLNQSGGYLFFPPYLKNSSPGAFIELIARLRSPGGCPWDRKQTHQTLRTNLLEETYEVLDAIDSNDTSLLQEELGDLLLQIVLHAQIASEEKKFSLFDVINLIHRKIVFRHPHVFGDWNVAGASEVMRNWEILKSKERDLKKDPEKRNLLDSIPKSLPALSLAQKYQERAARVGFDWPDISPVIDKIEEEIKELRDAQDTISRENELGDLLFAIVNLARWYGIDAESVLRQMNRRFLKRFSYIENTVTKQGKKLTDLTLSEMDDIWELAKQAEAIEDQTGQ